MSNNNTYFPPQKLATSQKTKKWFKQNIDAGESLIIMRNTDELTLKRKMQVWHNLDNDIIDEKEIENVFNPMQIASGTIPASIKNYSLTIPKLDLLQGEEIKRKFDWSVVSKNQDSNSEYSKSLRDSIVQLAAQTIQREQLDEKVLEKKLQEINKYYNYEYKDIAEITSNKILQYLWREQELKEKTSKGFRDAMKYSRELYRIDVVSKKVVVTKCDPRNVFAIRRGDSGRIEDSDIIIEITYEPVGSVIDEFHEYLSATDITEIEQGYMDNTNPTSGGVIDHENGNPIIYIEDSLNSFDDTRQVEQDFAYGYGLPFDVYGNVRVVRQRWLSRRKIGDLTYFDEEGNERHRYVPETYSVNKELGETVKWMWINEACEATKIANDKYVKMQIRENQIRHHDNPSLCFLGYVGTDYGESLVGRMEPYQYLYNVYMRRLELVMARYKGPIMEIDIAKKPAEWDIEEWMYYADTLGYMVVDSFKEGDKGIAKGQIAGHFNTTGKSIDPNIGNYIQQVVMMLQFIEKQIGKIAGVTDQREGQVSNRETVGGVERAVNQSSHITEKWFYIHDQTKKRLLQAMLDVAKTVYADEENVNINFILDDMSRHYLTFSGKDFASSNEDIFVSNSSEDTELRELIKQLSHAAVQNGASMSMPIKVLKSDSLVSMAKKIEEFEEMHHQRQEQQQQEQLASQERIAQAANDLEQRKLDMEQYKIDKDYEAKILTSQADNSDLEKAKLDLQKDKVDKDNNIKNKQLNETVRHNKATENLSKSKSTNSNR